jgi:Tol biopolymer transport system component
MKLNKEICIVAMVLLLSGCSAPSTAQITTNPSAPPTMTPLPTRTRTKSPFPATPANQTPLTSRTPTIFPPIRTNGPFLTYVRSAGDHLEIIFMDADGRGQKSIPYPIKGTDITTLLNPLSNVISPNGKWLAFYTGSAGESHGGHVGTDTADLTLNLMNLSDGKVQVITPLLSKNYPDNFSQAAREINQPDVTVEDLQNAFIDGIQFSIAWSPDGRYLAFAGQMDGLSSDVYSYDISSKTIQRLSSGTEEIQSIAWSPDSQWIVESSAYYFGEGMQCDLFATSLNGSTSRLLLHGTNDCGAGGIWLNKRSMFRSSQGNGIGTYGLLLVNVETGGVTKVWDANFTALSISSDQKLIAFYSNNILPGMTQASTPAPPSCYIINLAGMQVTKVKGSNGNDFSKSGVGVQNMETLGASKERMFLLRNENDGSLDYLSSDGILTPAGIQAINFSVSPDRQHWIAVGDHFQVYQADGTRVRDVDLPDSECPDGCGFWDRDFLWRPDSSGVFLLLENNRYKPDYPNHLYAMDLLSGGVHLVETEIWEFANPVWILGQ